MIPSKPDRREEVADFARPFLFDGNDRVRCIAGVGPAYEALADRGEFIRVRIVGTEDTLDYLKADAELDPWA